MCGSRARDSEEGQTGGGPLGGITIDGGSRRRKGKVKRAGEEKGRVRTWRYNWRCLSF